MKMMAIFTCSFFFFLSGIALFLMDPFEYSVDY